MEGIKEEESSCSGCIFFLIVLIIIGLWIWDTFGAIGTAVLIGAAIIALAIFNGRIKD